MLGTGHRDRADFQAVLAGRALGEVHVPRVLPQFHLQGTGFPLDAIDARVGPDGNAGVLGDLQEPRVEQVARDGGCAAIAQEGGGLDKMDVDSRGGQIQCGLDAGNAATRDECAFAQLRPPGPAASPLS